MFMTRVAIAASFALLILATAAPTGSAFPNRLDERRSVEEAALRFLRAFENLDMPSFISCFAQDATVFFPVPEPPQRFDGKAAIRRQFDQVFTAIRKTSINSGPPYHRLNPENLAVQLVGTNAAIVSFHLRNSERVGRRTLILERVGGAWLIVHLHASNVPIPLQSPQQTTPNAAASPGSRGLRPTTNSR